jgi:hypothetical protein
MRESLAIVTDRDRRCVEFAAHWPANSLTTIVALRLLLFNHARKDPRTAVELLTHFEEAYLESRARKRSQKLAPVDKGATDTPDLDEEFRPLLGK